MKKKILLCTVGILFITAYLCGCAAIFQPTETPAYGVSNFINPSSTSTSDVSKYSTPSATESLSQVSSSTSSVESTSSGESSSSASSDIPPSSERHPRFLELEKQFSYDKNGKICLSESQAAFADKSLFVGDSICRGFTAYNVVKAKNVYAAGSVGARNFFEMEFHYYGEPTEYSDVLEQVQPENVFLSMGMNDVNITTAQQFCENYRKLIDFTLEHSSAKVYVCAITPIRTDFTEHSRIDAFNIAIKNYITENYGQRVGFIDFGYLLKNSENMLAAGLDSGDGIHLAPECYFIAMLEICSQLGVPIKN